MKKRIISIVLTLVIILSLSVPAFATDQATNEPALSADAEQEFIENNYDKYTITFDSSAKRSTSSYIETERDMNYNQAVAFVNSLDLEEYPDIKEENLAYLDSLYEIGATITSYSVLVPLSDDIYTYGTYNGNTYFYKYYGNASYEILENEERNSTVLSNFENEVVNFLISLLGDFASYTWTGVKLVLDIPSGYSIQSGDYVEYKVKVSATLRGIYTQDYLLIFGSNPAAIVRVYTGEAGTARSYMVYHYGSTGVPEPEVSNWIGPQVFTETPDYYDTTATMSKAESLYLIGFDSREYLSDVVISNASLYFG